MAARRASAPAAGLAAPPAARPAAQRAAHRVRIVGGAWKRTPLEVPDAPGLRPTPDRVRETLFNWLGQALDGRACLDPFAGTGALGLEAASRGARRVGRVARDRVALAGIRAAVARLRAAQVELVAGDAFEAMERLARGGERFDVVLLDPPFGQGLLERAFAWLPRLLAAGGAVYVESEVAFEPPSGWRVERRGRAGRVHYHLVRRDDASLGEPP